jgi:hypothetical protein
MRRPVNRAPRLQNETLPPPVGGLNTLDAVANMPPTDAVILDNYFPGTADVPLRNGFQTWGSGLTNVETLAVYTAGTTKKMFAVTGGRIYDVSANQPIGNGNVVVEGHIWPARSSPVASRQLFRCPEPTHRAPRCWCISMGSIRASTSIPSSARTSFLHRRFLLA